MSFVATKTTDSNASDFKSVFSDDYMVLKCLLNKTPTSKSHLYRKIRGKLMQNVSNELSTISDNILFL